MMSSPTNTVNFSTHKSKYVISCPFEDIVKKVTMRNNPLESTLVFCLISAMMHEFEDWTGFSSHEDGGYIGEPPECFEKFCEIIEKYVMKECTEFSISPELARDFRLGDKVTMKMLCEVRTYEEVLDLARQIPLC